MSEYFAKVNWVREHEEAFTDNKYSRGHEWEFEGGARIQASSSPHIVPLPYSIAENIDPEEAFVASISSCHMLFFLSNAAKYNYVVNSYEDNAIGVMSKGSDDKISMTQVTLKPYVTFSGDNKPTQKQLEEIHHRSHEQCFIANSVKTDIFIDMLT